MNPEVFGKEIRIVSIKTGYSLIYPIHGNVGFSKDLKFGELIERLEEIFNEKVEE